MRLATAVRRLRTIAERCQHVCALWDPDAGLVGVQAFGPVLDPADEDGSIEVIQIALVVNEDPDEVTWCSRPPTFSGLPYVLDLEKAPVDWYFRSAGRPVGNHRIVRPLPIWSRQEGVHEEALTALASGRAEQLDRFREAQPRPAVLQRQLGEELVSAAAHLRRVRDEYWARGWRKVHHAAGTYPENYLWDAVDGYLDLLAAVGGAPGSAESAAAVAIDAIGVEPGRREPGRAAAAGGLAAVAHARAAGVTDTQPTLPVDPGDGDRAERTERVASEETTVGQAGTADAGPGRRPRRSGRGRSR